MKNKTILLIVFISLAIFIIFGMISCSLVMSYANEKDQNVLDFNFDSEKATEAQSAEVSLEGIENIEISTVSSKVILTESDEMLTSKLTFSFFENSAKIKLSSYVEGDTAYIDIIYPQSFIKIAASTLTVGLPSSFDGNITVKSVSGDVIGNLENNLSTFKLDNTSGSLQLSAPRINDVYFKSESGNMDLNTGIESSLSASSTSGYFTVLSMDNANANVTLKTVSGNVAVVYNETCPTAIETTSGDIDLALLDKSAIWLEFDSVSGDVDGPVRTDPDGVPFDITSVSGGLTFE